MDMTVVDGGKGPLRLVLQGRLDAAGTERLEAAFSSAVAKGTGDAVVDLSGVTFVGSLGIRLLITAARDAARRKRRVVICGVQPAVAEVFATVSLDDLIPIEADAAAAIARLGA